MRKLLIFIALYCMCFQVHAQKNEKWKERFKYIHDRRSFYISYSIMGFDNDINSISGLGNLLAVNNAWNRTLNNFDLILQAYWAKWLDVGISIHKYTEYNDINIFETSYLLNSNIPINTSGEKSEQNQAFVGLDIHGYLPIPIFLPRIFVKSSFGMAFITQNNYLFNNDDIVLHENFLETSYFTDIGLGMIVPLNYDKLWFRLDISRRHFLGENVQLKHIEYDELNQQINWVDRNTPKATTRLTLSLMFSPRKKH